MVRLSVVGSVQIPVLRGTSQPRGPSAPACFFSYRDSNHKTTSTNMSKCDQYHLCWFPRREAHRPEPSPGTDGKKARFGGLFLWFIADKQELVPAPGFELGTY